jgi:hypothetical protein
VLEGLLEHERATGGSTETLAARQRGEEYLLKRRLFRRLSTGDVVEPDWLCFSFPSWWYYDVLRALDYFRAAEDDPDPRLAQAVDLVRSKTARQQVAAGVHPSGRGALTVTASPADGSRCGP